MAKFVFAMNISLDGFVDYDKFAPGPLVFRHWIEVTRNAAGSIYGRKLYEIMRYWDDEQPEWGEAEHEFAVAWREQPKWVVSKTLTEVGPNATLISDNVEEELRALKDKLTGEIDIGGPVLVGSLAGKGLIDEYRLYYHPVVVGSGDPFFAGSRPPLKFAGSDEIAEGVVRMTYVPA